MENIKILKLKNVSLAALLIASATLAACSSSDDNIIEEQPVNPTEPKTYTMIVQATKGDDATTRGLSLDGIHLILEDAGQAPVFGGFGGHLYLAGDAVGDVTQELDKFRVRVLVAKVLGDKLV